MRINEYLYIDNNYFCCEKKDFPYCYASFEIDNRFYDKLIEPINKSLEILIIKFDDIYNVFTSQEYASGIVFTLISRYYDSFIQNPDALYKVIDTGFYAIRHIEELKESQINELCFASSCSDTLYYQFNNNLNYLNYLNK